MDDKIAFVVDSIKKLLVLRVSDEEIIAELSGVGISKEDAIELINKAKENNSQEAINEQKPKEQEKKSSVIYDEVSSKLSMDEQVVNQLNIKNDEVSKSTTPNVNSIFENELGGNDDFNDYQPVKDETSEKNKYDKKTNSSVVDLKNNPKNKSTDELEDDEGGEIQDSIDSLSDEEIIIKSNNSAVLNNNSKNTLDNVVDEGSNSKLIDEIQSNFIKNKPLENVVQKDSQVQKVQENIQKVNPVIENKTSVIDSTKKEILQNPSARSSIPKITTPSFVDSQNYSSSFNQSKLDESLQNFSQKTKTASAVNSQNSYSSYQKRADVSQTISNEMDTLWKKGIVVAVNSKLIEMRKLKEEVDSNISEKVDASVKKEVAQLRILLDSQRELLIANNKAALEDKQKEISFIIDSKIAELKQSNKQLSANLAALELAKSEQKASLDQIKQMLEEARRTKAQLLVEMNSELIKSKSQAQAFLDNADKHLRELDERVNRTLELQKNIADGMIEQAEQKIEELTLQKTDELVEDLEVRLNRLKVIETEINPDLLVQKIKTLDDFKKQFVETMKDNITQINVAIEEINKKNVDLDQSITQKMLTIDAKIEELTKFEKEFTEIINNLTEKM